MRRSLIFFTYRDREYKLIPYFHSCRCIKCDLNDLDDDICLGLMDKNITCTNPVRGYWKETFRSKWRRFVKNNIVDDYPYDESHSWARYGN